MIIKFQLAPIDRAQRLISEYVFISVTETKNVGQAGGDIDCDRIAEWGGHVSAIRKMDRDLRILANIVGELKTVIFVPVANKSAYFLIFQYVGKGTGLFSSPRAILIVDRMARDAFTSRS